MIFGYQLSIVKATLSVINKQLIIDSWEDLELG